MNNDTFGLWGQVPNCRRASVIKQEVGSVNREQVLFSKSTSDIVGVTWRSDVQISGLVCSSKEVRRRDKDGKVREKLGCRKRF